jgi:hypothetical protein
MRLNVAYKHLESRLRIAELTVGQWAGVFVGVMTGLIWASYLSPFGTYLTLISAVYLAGMPVVAAFLASFTEFDLWLHLRALLNYRRSVGRFVPGPGDTVTGYVVEPDEAEDLDDLDLNTNDLDLQELFQ